MVSPGKLYFNLQALLEEFDKDELDQFKFWLRSLFQDPIWLMLPKWEFPLTEVEQANGGQLAEILLSSGLQNSYVELVTTQALEKMNRMDLCERIAEEVRATAAMRRLERNLPSLETEESESSNPEKERPSGRKPEHTQVDGEDDDGICLKGNGWTMRWPGKKDKFRMLLKKTYWHIWQIWRNSFNPRTTESFPEANPRYKMQIPFCDPRALSGMLPYTVVLQGPSGVGKTTLAKAVLLDWIQDSLAMKFEYAFYLSCEELNRMGPCTFADLITKDFPELRDAMPDDLDRSHNTLIIVDGFNELRCHPGVLISGICANWKVKKPVPILLSSLLSRNLLPRATLLITMQTWAWNRLRYLVERPFFVDMEGLSEVERKEYFLQHFQDEDQALQAFNLMRSNEALFRMGSSPVVCWVVSTCLKLQMEKGEDPTPTCETTTSLFLRFICSQFTPAPGSCPSEGLQAPVKSLCLLAAEGVWTQITVFDDEDLKRLEINDCELSPFLDKNILQKSKDRAGYYSFIHLSVQQFFAAMFYVLRTKEEEVQGIPKGDIGDIQQLFSKEETLKNPSLIEVGYFLFGLANEKRVRELETTFGCPVTRSVEVKQEIVRWKVNTSGRKRPLLPMAMKEVVDCLCESQEEDFVKDAVVHFKEVSLKLKNEKDLVQVSFCLKHCQNLQKLSLKIDKGIFLENNAMEVDTQDERSQKDQHILPFWMDLCSLFGSNKNPIFLEINRSFLSDSSVRILCDQIASTTHSLQNVVLDNIVPASAYQDLCLTFSGHESLTHLTLQSIGQNDVFPPLCEVLRHPKCNLQYLRLGSCSATTQQWDGLFSVLTINQSLTCLNLSASELLDEGLKLLCRALKHPQCSLQRLSLENCHLTEASCKDLSSALIINQKLTHLSLAKNKLGDGGLQLLCEGLSYPDCKLQTLVLWECDITDNGCSLLSKLLQQKSSLTHLDLELNYIGVTGLHFLCEVLKDPTCNLKHLWLKVDKSDTEMQKLVQEIKGSNPQVAIEKGTIDLKLNRSSSYDFLP